MSRRTGAKVSAAFLFAHGIIEITGPVVLMLNPQMASGFETGSIGLMVIGLIWGTTRFAAGWGIRAMKKWAVMLGILMSVITMTAAINVIPAGIVDTILSAPALIFLLYTWFGRETLWEEERC